VYAPNAELCVLNPVAVLTQAFQTRELLIKARPRFRAQRSLLRPGKSPRPLNRVVSHRRRIMVIEWADVSSLWAARR
jgi:hypothetical protein